MPDTGPNPDQIWQATLGELRLQLGQLAYDKWLRDAVLLKHDADSNCFVIRVNDSYAKEWLERRLLSTIQRTLSAMSGQPAQVRFEVAPSDNEITQEASTDPWQPDWGAAGIPDKFVVETLETLDWSQPAFEKPELREYVEHALAYMRAGIGLTLVGPTGLGKTHLAIGLLKKALEANWSGHFIGAVTLLDEIRATFDSARQGRYGPTERHILRKLSRVGLLVLDDLRVDGLTVWGRDRLYAILNPRWERSLPTITTSNYTPDELARPAGRDRLGLDDGTLSRLVRTTLTLQLNGADYRLEQKRRTLAEVREHRHEPPNNGQ